MPTKPRQEFGRYLRARRASVAPQAQASEARRSRRQVRGLRRQELAAVAEISVEYLIRLEQGRVAHPSRGVLSSLARALELLPGQRDHLFRLAGELPPEPTSPSEQVRPGLSHLLEGLTTPATVHDGRLDVLARNSAATELLGQPHGTGPYDRNIVYQGFAPSARRVLGEEGAARYGRWATAELRTAIARYPHDARLQGLVKELTATSADFRRHWGCGEVACERSGIKRLLHPAKGWHTFHSEMLHDAQQDHWVVIYTPTT
ncbi:helix-turn-helix transcriptional regulator [Streptomonospora arabica]|uniref:Helix-turn-helix domain-containing protein n=1 Tax=Streptomonospora arabica TaxID=412417 RepID=A0ABV9SJR2_9ACTN